ncbi:hypothetical protein PYW07_016078 [Mythimna separata]|uniref:Malate dehydrogenase, mitochondrial n=1 Tax=Mythimna separata TaxID=271217 RepID=A0AAD7YRT1_MYTSE|nr:hypothetical protein PYW07_016078 [Mythimna separata]
MNKIISRRILDLCSSIGLNKYTARINKRNYQVTVAGGASEIGQTLSLLLRSEPGITKLVVHDTRLDTPGVVMDLSHIPTDNRIQGYTGEDSLETALKDANIVIGAGGVIRKPGISEKLWLSSNTEFVRTLSKQVAKMESMPFLGIITEPINYLVPMAAEVLRNHGDYDSRKLFGITGLDALHAQALFAAQNNLNPEACYVPVIGGHSDKTLIPLLSQSTPASDFDTKMSQDFTIKFRRFDEELLKANRGCSPTTSVAYSALLFTRCILNALDGQPAKVHAFIENNDFGTAYFGGLVHLDSEGVKDMQIYSSLTQYELQLLELCLDELRRDALKGKKVLEIID